MDWFGLGIFWLVERIEDLILLIIVWKECDSKSGDDDDDGDNIEDVDEDDDGDGITNGGKIECEKTVLTSEYSNC